MINEDKDREEEELPQYIQGAKFITLGTGIDEDFWPRDPAIYDPTMKFIQRFKEFGKMVNGNAVEDAIKYGELYPVLNNNAVFINDLGGVAYYIIVAKTLKKNLQKKLQREDVTLADIKPTQNEYNYSILSLWPYVYNKDKAWEYGWSSEQLERIDELTDKITVDEINQLENHD